MYDLLLVEVGCDVGAIDASDGAKVEPRVGTIEKVGAIVGKSVGEAVGT